MHFNSFIKIYFLENFYLKNKFSFKGNSKTINFFYIWAFISNFNIPKSRKMKPFSKILLWSLSALTFSAAAQQDTTVVDDFSNYGDADTKVTKSYCNQKVNFLTPSKLISIGFERQEAFHWHTENKATTAHGHNEISNAQGLRLLYSTPVISRTDMILNLSVSHWETKYNAQNTPTNDNFLNQLDTRGLRSTSLQATYFKPLNEKTFLLFQAQADINGDFRKLSEISNNNLTYSGVAVYGWKKNDNLMWGIGAARTYRLGQLIYVPVILWNKTFNANWGVEALFPARAVVRRNFGTTSLLTLGYELEGNTYHINNVGFLRRGEIKPRLTYERQLKNFIWLTAQAGLRINQRFDVYATQNPAKDETARIISEVGNPFFFNIGIHLVSP